MKRIFSILFALVLAVSLMLVPAASVGASPEPGLVGEWHFDEGSGTTASDSSGYGNDGTIYGASWTTSGKLGNALSFDGSNDYVSVPDSLSLDIGTSDFTIEAWIKLGTTADDYYGIYDKGKGLTSGEGRYSLFVTPSDTLRLHIYGQSGGEFAYYDSTLTIDDTNWHYVAVSCDRDGNAIFAIDDATETVDISGSSSHDVSSTYDAAIGVRQWDKGDHWFNGEIDEIRIWDTAHPPLHVDDDGAQYATPYTTITAALAVAGTGDTIIVHEGTYDPFTVDGKTDLTIQSNSVVTVQGAQSVTTAYTDRDCVVFVKDSTDIVLDGLNIQGQGLGTATKDYGVIYENSSGEIKDCTVSPNTIGDMNSTAIGIWDGSDVDVESCTAENYGRIGVFIYNGCTVDIIGGSIEGQVYTGEDQVCYGVEVEGAWMSAEPETASHVIIDGVEIYNCDNTYSPEPSWGSSAVLINGWLEYFNAADSTVEITNCKIHDNYGGIYAIKSPSSYAHFNNIYDNRECGVESAAAYDDSTAVFDAEKNWWGDCSGPSGVGLGSGDSVSANVDYDPWLGQQLCALRAAIAALDDEDFEKQQAASGQRQALLDKVDAVCDQYDDGSYRGALNKLQHDVIKKLEKWLVDGTALINMVEDEIEILEGFLE